MIISCRGLSYALKM
jgi:hypothetical protein